VAKISKNRVVFKINFILTCFIIMLKNNLIFVIFKERAERKENALRIGSTSGAKKTVVVK